MHFWLGSDADDEAGRVAGSEADADRLVIVQDSSDLAERTVISLQGTFDVDHAAEVWQLLRNSVAYYRTVLVDLSEVRQIDSAGLACLAEAYRLARQSGATFALIGANRQAEKMLKLSGLHRAIRQFRSVAEALTGLASLAVSGVSQARTFSENLTGPALAFSNENLSARPRSPVARRVA